MNQLSVALASLSLLLSSCLSFGPATDQASALPMQTARFELLDSSRQRLIPVAAYYPAAASASLAAATPPPKLKLALLNHGYGVKHTAYSFVAQNLVAHGYYVVSLQQDLPTDAPIPQAGNSKQMRYPYWKRGGENIAFVIRAMQRRNPALDTQHVLLLGHSYGGDIAMLFAQEHPAMVAQVISFDNCRVPLPRTRQPRVFSLRSSDQVADPGVLPTPACCLPPPNKRN